MEWVESTGKSIDEAKDVALDRLGVHEDDAEFEIVAEAKVGLFGRVKEEARVRARVRPATPRAKEERRRPRGGRSRGGRDQNQKGGRGGQRNDRRPKGERGGGSGGGARSGARQKQNGGGSPTNGGGEGRRASAGESRSRDDGGTRQKNGGGSRPTKEKPVSDDQPTMPLPQQADIAEQFVGGLAERFGASVTFERTEVDEDIHLTVSGDDLGRMIGRRGSTASAIDELVRTVLQRQAGSSRDGRIRVDIGGVRARRTEALTTFVQDLAAQVRDTGEAKALEPMGGADRKTVHDVINDEDGVDTISEGEDPNRRVVIVPAGDAD